MEIPRSDLYPENLLRAGLAMCKLNDTLGDIDAHPYLRTAANKKSIIAWELLGKAWLDKDCLSNSYTALLLFFLCAWKKICLSSAPIKKLEWSRHRAHLHVMSWQYHSLYPSLLTSPLAGIWTIDPAGTSLTAIPSDFFLIELCFPFPLAHPFQEC